MSYAYDTDLMKDPSLAPLFLLLIFNIFNFPLFAMSPVNKEAEEYFQQGQAYYTAKDYSSALPLYQKATELAPSNSIYHHLLGKCYGRLAEEGSWLTALRYVRKTLAQFKKAVDLDANNTEAWIDLEEFHRRAPVFLGGDKNKAKEIRTYLDSRKLDDNTTNHDATLPEAP
ncbi:MAG: tetratricopeptide (TPR) repeat protein [Planctomycetota bacterium]|jgi:tetratricopeptide (TPR) repeat protein